jgi:hypothetical protein
MRGVTFPMKNSRAIRAKIVQHAEGLGLPDTNLIQKRAQEIAQIAGRSESNEEDWQQAKRELHGGHAYLDDGEDQMIGAATEREVPGTLGHHIENVGLEDAENVSEELIAEGMDEAVHEQMLEASRNNSDEED